MSVGTTVVAMSVDDVPLAAVALRDKLAPFARSCVAQLEMSGVQAKLGWWGYEGLHLYQRCQAWVVLISILYEFL